MRQYLSTILDWLGFRSYIKIPNRGFEDLSSKEISLMIDSYLDNGNNYFESNALYEFLLMRYKNKEIENVRNEINSIHQLHKRPDAPDGLSTTAGKKALFDLSQRLRDS